MINKSIRLVVNILNENFTQKSEYLAFLENTRIYDVSGFAVLHGTITWNCMKNLFVGSAQFPTLLVSKIWPALPFVYSWSSFCWNFWDQHKYDFFARLPWPPPHWFRCPLNDPVPSTLLIIIIEIIVLQLYYLIFTH